MKTINLLVTFFVLLLFAGFLNPALHAAEEYPNIVLIISDDQHWGDYGFMGHSVLKTPCLDRLAEQGLLFTRGYVPASLCCPSLASLITGQYPHQHRITSNDPPLPEGMKKGEFYKTQAYRDGRNMMIEQMKKAPTLPKLLAQHGYLSMQTGKWWLGDYSSGGFTHGMTKGGRHGDDGLKIGRDTMKPITDFLDLAAKEKKPFFLWYAPMLPHDPHDPPEQFLNNYKDKTNSIHQAKYWGNVERFDNTCGQLLDELEQRGLNEKTIVAYVCDNGWIQDQNSHRFAPKSKQSQYDGGLRTPIIVRWTGHITPNRNNTHSVSSLDIVPTLLKLAGLEKDTSQPGIDLLDSNAVESRKAVFGECFTHDFVDLLRPEKNLRFRWMIEDGWKLIVPQSGERTGIELYYLTDDPNETKNLAQSQQQEQRIESMLSKLNSFYDPQKP
ncbi:MAG: sulfatase [Planctomycetaceae bacterium]|jgi:uncharacterized sulfatase|nr:sulfatase [Planctomycetaceae bacterium]